MVEGSESRDAQLLGVEAAYFDEHREEFLKEHFMKFVLIKGEKQHGFYDTADNAYEAGLETFGLEPFLIKQVLAEDEMYKNPAYTLGLMHASF